MSTFSLSILSPGGELYSGEAESISVPSPDGRWGIFPNRAACVIALAPGPIRYCTGGTEHTLWVRSGILRFTDNRGTVLVTPAGPEKTAPEHPEPAKNG